MNYQEAHLPIVLIETARCHAPKPMQAFKPNTPASADAMAITTLMITHNMNSALKTGNRTIMMDSGEIILDVSGEEREKMTLDDLLNLYSLKKKEAFANDRMLLG